MHLKNYTIQISAIGEEVTVFISDTSSHLTLHRYSLSYLQIRIERDEARTLLLRLFYPIEPAIRNVYLSYVNTANDEIQRLFNRGEECVALARACQESNFAIEQILRTNRDAISEAFRQKNFLYRWLYGDEDSARETLTMNAMNEFLGPVLDLLISILDKLRDLRAEFSALQDQLGSGRVGSTTAQLVIQLQRIADNIVRLDNARNYLIGSREMEAARHEQQLKDNMLRYEPLP